MATKEELNAVRYGDVLHWDDPDGECSRTSVVKHVSVREDFVVVLFTDDSVLEAPFHELTVVPPRLTVAWAEERLHHEAQ